jgi:hypothetical protein
MSEQSRVDQENKCVASVEYLCKAAFIDDPN